mgnify:CR=1 FL=1
MSYLFNIIIMCCITAGIIITEGNASQELNINGKVMDLKGSPVSGATVKIKDADSSAITDKNGDFSFGKNVGIISYLGKESAQPNFAFLSGGKIKIRTSKRTLVCITGFNLSGKAVYQKKRFVNAGVHVFSTPSLKHGVTLFRVTEDDRTVYLKTYTLGGIICGKVQAETINPLFSEASARHHSADQFKDTIFITKSGYLKYALRINKTDIGGLKIRLANEDHPKISKKHIYEPGTVLFRACHAATILELPDGTLLSAFFGGSAEGARDVEIRLCRKEPGKEWTAPINVADGMLNGERHSTGNPALFQTFDGKIMLFYKILTDRRYGAMKTSTDGGKTWSKMQQICKECIGPEKNKPVQLEDGTIIAPSSDRNGDSGIRVEISKDNGETWTTTTKGIGGGTQPTVLFHPDNRLQMMFRTDGHTSIGVTWSDDNGETWSEPEGSALPNNNSGIDAVTLRNGRHLLAYNHAYRNEMGHKGRGILNVALSNDGKAWEAATIVNYYPKSGYQYSYPAVIQSRNGLVHLVHTWHRRTIDHVVINPAALKTEPVIDGKWPSSGHLSLEEWKKDNPGWDNPTVKR